MAAIGVSTASGSAQAQPIGNLLDSVNNLVLETRDMAGLGDLGNSVDSLLENVGMYNSGLYDPLLDDLLLPDVAGDMLFDDGLLGFENDLSDGGVLGDDPSARMEMMEIDGGSVAP